MEEIVHKRILILTLRHLRFKKFSRRFGKSVESLVWFRLLPLAQKELNLLFLPPVVATEVKNTQKVLTMMKPSIFLLLSRKSVNHKKRRSLNLNMLGHLFEIISRHNQFMVWASTTTKGN